MDYSQQNYDLQLEQKRQQTLEQFSPFGVDEIEVFASPIVNYRMRSEFRVWHEGEDLFYVMFNQETKEKYKVESFPPANKLINALMGKVVDSIKVSETLRRKLFQIDYLSCLNGEVVISLLYHRQLDEAWEAAARELKEGLKQALSDEVSELHIIGRARKQKKVLDAEFVIEKLQVHDRTYTYKQVENSFTQPNGEVAQKMLEWAVDATRGSEADLLELYCGNGNFSIALAQNFRQVLATELAKPSVDSAQWNIQENGIENLKIARLSAEEFTEAMNGVREFRRLQQQDINLADYDFRTVFVDPPRAGMDEESVRMVQAYDTIVYISCNPDTLEENIKQLSPTHKVTNIALFDQFPYTHHREVGVVLSRVATDVD